MQFHCTAKADSNRCRPAELPGTLSAFLCRPAGAMHSRLPATLFFEADTAAGATPLWSPLSPMGPWGISVTVSSSKRHHFPDASSRTCATAAGNQLNHVRLMVAGSQAPSSDKRLHAVTVQAMAESSEGGDLICYVHQAASEVWP